MPSPSLSLSLLSSPSLIGRVPHLGTETAQAMADTQDKVSPAPATAPPSDTTADVPSGMDGQGPNKTHVNIVEHARAAAHKERNMTLRQGIKLYPKAIFWSVLISTCIVMEGYDISLVNNFCMSQNSSLTIQCPSSCLGIGTRVNVLLIPVSRCIPTVQQKVRCHG